MPPQLADCEALAMQLSPADRALLAEHLLASLATPADVAEHDRLWLAEIVRRDRDYQAGRLESLPLQDALQALRDTGP